MADSKKVFRRLGCVVLIVLGLVAAFPVLYAAFYFWMLLVAMSGMRN